MAFARQASYLAALGILFAIAIIANSAKADGDPERGQRVFNLCKTCHTIDKGGKHMVGPNLSNIIGRKAGSVEGFKYSDSLIKSGIVWNDENLSKYVLDPKGLVPGNKMAFAGVKKESDREDLIAYLKKATAK